MKDKKELMLFRKLDPTDDLNRRLTLLKYYNLTMGFMALVMSIVNLFTKEYILLCATAFYSLLCSVNLLLIRRNRGWFYGCQHIFTVESLILCSFFCLSGIPEGFSALWICFIPSFALSMMGVWLGSIYASVGLLVIVFLFWMPWGREMLMYSYTDVFMLRFPFLYVAFYGMAWLQEKLRMRTQQKLSEMEQKYRFLYRHDALTGLYNRYGFNELMDEAFTRPELGPVTLFIMDLDFFKQVNDTYGHHIGDKVLCKTAQALLELGGPEALACRWGGEEFTLLLRNCADPAGLAEELRSRMENAAVSADDGTDVRWTVSVGVCSAQNLSEITIAQLVTGADHCLYAAKDAGRNAVRELTL